jgi:hypothetical protein
MTYINRDPANVADNPTSLFVAVQIAYVIVLSSALLVWIAYFLDRGIDLTDEGFYLNSIAHYDLYPYSVTQFGPLLHWVFDVLNYDVIWLRLAGYVGLLVCVGTLSTRAINHIPICGSQKGLRSVALFLMLLASTMLFYCIWLPTPNYNMLNLMGGLFVATGVLGAPRWRPGLVAAIDMACIGAGLALCALVKPPTAVCLIPLVAASLKGSLRQRLLLLVVAGAISACLVLAVLLFTRGSIATIINNYTTNLALFSILMDSNSNLIEGFLWRSFPFPAEQFFIVSMIVFGALLGCLNLAGGISQKWRFVGIGAVLVCGAVFCFWVQFFPNTWNRPANWTPLLLTLGMSATILVWTRRLRDTTLLHEAIILILMPFAIGFGSNTGMLRSAGQAAPIWAVASVLLLASTAPGQMLQALLPTLMAVSVSASAIVIAWAHTYPQRQLAPLWAQHELIAVYGHEASLRVDPLTAAYFRTLRSAAQGSGFSRRTPVIDLTGIGPVTIFALGGRAIGGPYMFGGYPGSATFAQKSLGLVPRQSLEQAWVLTSTDGHVRLPDAVLSNLGLPFPSRYREVTRAVTGIYHETQVLWRPSE